MANGKPNWRPLRVVAHLASPLAGNSPPQLDALLEWCLCFYIASISESRGVGYSRSKITRADPCYGQGEIPIPIKRTWLGGWLVAHCTNAILSPVRHDGREFINKRIGVEHAELLAPNKRLVVSTTNSWTKSYRLPLRIRNVESIVWLCVGDRREIKRRLSKEVHSLGKKVSDGYGRVSGWEVEEADFDERITWYAAHESGEVLMRTMPVGDWLPKNLVGAKRDFGACTPPYWHPERYTEIVTPC